TSNMGSDALLASVSEHGEITQGCREQVMAALRTNFRPEFLNRVDDIVLFKPLSLQEVEKIASLFVKQLQQRLANQQVDLQLSDDAMRYLAQEGYDPVYGARPMKRFIQQVMETPLARLLVSGEASVGSTVKVDCDGQALKLSVNVGRED
ncbi:MAG: type VI secretion system ATPase TssH, partial [Mariprofundaceae bacterium]|nr:type VI secretion system ATPase TssH [Mariprofundaceae bacterium]